MQAYTYGIFETMRSLKGNIVYLNAHLKRFRKSARLLKLNISYSCKYLESLIKKAVSLSKLRDSRIKLAVFKDKTKPKITITVKKYIPYVKEVYNRGFKVQISPLRQRAPLALTQVKSLKRILFESAYNRAKRQGFDEAIILNQEGFIAEGSRTNIFLVRNKKLFTPSLDCGCLGGITRKVVFDLAKAKGIRIYETKLTVEDISKAEELFLTNSLMGIMPVSYCDRKKIGESVPGEITQVLIKEYKKLTKDGSRNVPY